MIKLNCNFNQEANNMGNRSGTYIQNLSGDLAYKSFKPALLPPVPSIEISDQILSELVEANRKIAYLNGLSAKIPNISLFISMYVRKEALLSSQIEGTQCTLDDILDPLLEDNENRDVGDVLNYIKACDFAVDRLKSLPLCNRLIKETHAILLAGVRGKDKNPGEFRTSQNWIGGEGSSLKNARYIPPNPEDMSDSMTNLEKYINEDDTLDPLIQAALIHYQFETIHPFLDGNGRIGRLLITLFLIEKKILNTPVLYISYYLKMYRIEYYDRMTQIRSTGNYEQWIEFFLKALSSSADDAIETINKLTDLHNTNYQKITDSYSSRHSQNVLKLFDYLESNPIIDTKKTADVLNIAYNTAASSIKELIKTGILIENPKKGREKTFSYDAYLQILRKDT